MGYDLWIKGFSIGVLAALPTGPVGFHCFNKSLVKGKISGIISATGIACANTVWVFLVFNSLAIVDNFMTKYDILLRFIGSVLICIIGIKGLFESKTNTIENRSNNILLFKEFTTTFIAVLTNPMTFIRYSIIFACIGMIKLSIQHTIEMSLLVFLGIISTWLFIIFITHKMREKINLHSIQILNKILSGIVIVLGIAILISLITEIPI